MKRWFVPAAEIVGERSQSSKGYLPNLCWNGGTIKYFRSLFKLCWMIVLQVIRIIAALLQGDLHIAAEETRALAILTHDDLVQIVAAFQKLLPFWHGRNAAIDKILIVKLDRIGDMVNTTPVLDALRSVFPRASLDIVGHPTCLSLLQADDRVAQRISYKSWLYHPLPIRPPGMKSWFIVFKLLWQRYPVVVYLRGSFPFLLLAMTSRMAATKFIPGEPVVTRYLKPVESLWGSVPNRDPKLHISSENLRFAQNLLYGRNGCAGPRIGIHAGAGAPTKIWPPERFAALADELHIVCNAHVHFFGSPDDKRILEGIAGLAAHSHSFHWRLRLPQVAAMIAACDLFIGNDSGLAHVAAAVGTPLVVLWGPGNLNISRPKAPPDRCTILYHDLPCRPTCPEVRCVNPVHLECLLRTQTADVVVAARRLLKRSLRGEGSPILSRIMHPEF